MGVVRRGAGAHPHTTPVGRQAQELTPSLGLKYRVLNDKDVELGVRASNASASPAPLGGEKKAWHSGQLLASLLTIPTHTHPAAHPTTSG